MRLEPHSATGDRHFGQREGPRRFEASFWARLTSSGRPPGDQPAAELLSARVAAEVFSGRVRTLRFFFVSGGRGPGHIVTAV